jgi:hypothetical protein
VGALPRAPGGFIFPFVAIDTFTKWIEIMPVVNITQDAAVKFLQSIIYKFGVPKWVLTAGGHPTAQGLPVSGRHCRSWVLEKQQH